MIRTDIHHYEERLERAFESVKKCNRINPKNKELMLKFIEFKRAQGTSAGRCAKILWTLKKFAMGQYEKRHHRSKELDMMKDFDKLTKEDIQREFAKLESSGLRDSTKRDYKILVRFFVGWVFHEKTSAEAYNPKEHGYPKMFKGIRIKEPRETVKASDLLTDGERHRIIDATKNLRDKAIIACLDEAGMRPGELLSLKVGNVTIEEQYGVLSLDGKTGIRSSFIIRNLAYLAQWLDSHQTDDPNAPLWLDFGRPSEALSYAGLRQMLKRAVAKAGIRKRVYPYIFRHTSATTDSTELTEPIMRKLYGWSKNSKTPSRYEHLSGKDALVAKLRQAGLAVDEGKERIRICPRCKKPNPLDATMCHGCGSVLSVREAVGVQKAREADIEKIVETRVQERFEEEREGLFKELEAHLDLQMRKLGFRKHPARKA
ncbi:MAG: tyrosine-type recombinase/integrase [Promethearchaeota archaeon]